MKNVRSRIAGYLPLVLAFACTMAMAWEVNRRPTPADAEPFHTAAAEMIKALPIKFGVWEGVEVPVPQAAQSLLKPNALLSRSYKNTSTGERASLVLVQCKDTRDMGGHYPPICYPGQGWVEDGPQQQVAVTVGSRPVNMIRYNFRRESFDRDRRLVVYNFFAIPGQGLPTDMKSVRASAEDYTARPFGAGQFQVVLDGQRPIEREQAIVAELLGPLDAVIGLLSDNKWRSR